MIKNHVVHFNIILILLTKISEENYCLTQNWNNAEIKHQSGEKVKCTYSECREIVINIAFLKIFLLTEKSYNQ